MNNIHKKWREGKETDRAQKKNKKKARGTTGGPYVPSGYHAQARDSWPGFASDTSVHIFEQYRSIIPTQRYIA